MGRCSPDCGAEKCRIFVRLGGRAELGSDTAVFYRDAGGGYDDPPAGWGSGGGSDAAHPGGKMGRLTEDAAITDTSDVCRDADACAGETKGAEIDVFV